MWNLYRDKTPWWEIFFSGLSSINLSKVKVLPSKPKFSRGVWQDDRAIYKHEYATFSKEINLFKWIFQFKCLLWYTYNKCIDRNSKRLIDGNCLLRISGKRKSITEQNKNIASYGLVHVTISDKTVVKSINMFIDY